jgi:hypothetical protein
MFTMSTTISMLSRVASDASKLAGLEFEEPMLPWHMSVLDHTIIDICRVRVGFSILDAVKAASLLEQCGNDDEKRISKTIRTNVLPHVWRDCVKCGSIPSDLTFPAHVAEELGCTHTLVDMDETSRWSSGCLESKGAVTSWSAIRLEFAQKATAALEELHRLRMFRELGQM